jgi:hypothetical protein
MSRVKEIVSNSGEKCYRFTRKAFQVQISVPDSSEKGF